MEKRVRGPYWWNDIIAEKLSECNKLKRKQVRAAKNYKMSTHLKPYVLDASIKTKIAKELIPFSDSGCEICQINSNFRPFTLGELYKAATGSKKRQSMGCRYNTCRSN